MALSHQVIILLCLVGAAAAVLVGWGISTLVDKRTVERDIQTMDAEQQVYMRQLRLRNMEVLAAMHGKRWDQRRPIPSVGS